ncbi:tetratricopeptide repeat protein [Chitinimonas viridis]|uniref:protein O-GlcNAc transferase n=1 Tax=Chitinimonas viridis TaxID=664880 RepID=A0ABT8B6L4_9NEIS|nr:tetratricopeptide repeat protein [Chitinimonas viridis]MDN3577899.1 tetratricopeptide repeat protein [Chitinimonas viridis]
MLQIPRKPNKHLDRDIGRLLTVFNAGDFVQLEVASLAFLEKYPEQPFGLKALSSAYLALGKCHLAEPILRRAVALAPRDAELHNNLGISLSRLGQHELAVQSFQHAIRLAKADADTYINLAEALRLGGHFQAAEQAAHQAVSFAPGSAVAHRTLGTCLGVQRKLEAAVAALARSLTLDTTDVGALTQLAHVLHSLGRYADAVVCYEDALPLVPDDHDLADTLRGMLIFNHLMVCDWRTLMDDIAVLKARVEARSIGSLPPFPALSMPGFTAELQFQATRRFVDKRLEGLLSSTLNEEPAADLPQTRPDRLRIGYYSADFHEHATSLLLVGVLEAHDKSRFELFAYSYGLDDGSAMRHRVRAAFDHFHDVQTLSDLAIADVMRRDKLDILIDLKGWTADERLAVLAYRPAPIQVTWLGFPGTIGDARLADYVIGDAVVTPMEHAACYAESLALMPHCYQPNDQRRDVAPAMTRAEAGLPEQAVVFCSFNQSYKIAPDVFAAWCRILVGVPNSVLWLLNFEETAKHNLLSILAQHGLDESRLIFAPKLPPAQHLARLALADIALDTMPYNSHTTGSDALRAGVPLITVLGETFASRVAASLLRAVELEELVTHSIDDYVLLAQALASDRPRLAALRAHLLDGRNGFPLFDTPRFTRDLESLYECMHERYRAGLPPALITLDGGRS